MGCFPGRRSRRRLRIAARELEVVGGKTRLPLTSICRAFMAEPETATLAVASLPSSDELERAASFTREPFLLEGEDPAVALASGTPRRAALDWALSELADGREVPSTKWRRRRALVLGLARPLSPAPGPRPPALPGRAGARRRHRALRPPGRRALGHADRALRGVAARAQRQRERRSRQRRGRGGAARARLSGDPGRGGPARGARRGRARGRAAGLHGPVPRGRRRGRRPPRA